MKLDKFHVLVREARSCYHSCSISSASVCWCAGEICPTVSTIKQYTTINYWFKKSKKKSKTFTVFPQFLRFFNLIHYLHCTVFCFFYTIMQWTWNLATCNVLFIYPLHVQCYHVISQPHHLIKINTVLVHVYECWKQWKCHNPHLKWIHYKTI